MNKLISLLVFSVVLVIGIIILAITVLNFNVLNSISKNEGNEKTSVLKKNRVRTVADKTYSLKDIDHVLLEEEEFIQEDINIYYEYVQFLDKTDTYLDRDIL